MYWLTDIIIRYWPVTDISVSEYMLSDVCRQENFYSTKKMPKYI